jgi:hypothetical protein
MLAVMNLMQTFEPLQAEISHRKAACESISRQLRGWAESLQNSDIQGQRHLNDQSREKYDNDQKKAAARQKRADFKRELEQRLKQQADERRQQEEEGQSEI